MFLRFAKTGRDRRPGSKPEGLREGIQGVAKRTHAGWGY